MNRFNIHKRADRMRKRPMQHEMYVRTALHRHRILFQHQYIVGNYIADFYLFDRDLVIEIDGTHLLRKDKRTRDEYIKATLGCDLIRWQNRQVTTELPSLIKYVRDTYPVTNTRPPNVG